MNLLTRFVIGCGGRTACALADQAVVSGGNVAMAVLVGRFLGAQALGAYTLLFTTILIANSVRDATLSSSFMIRRPELDAEDLRRYAAADLTLAGGLIATTGIVVSAVVMLGGGLGKQVQQVGWLPLFGSVVAFLLREHLRRYEFAARRMASALLFDLAAYGTQLGAIALIASVAGLDLCAILLGTAIGQGGVALAMLLYRADAFRAPDLPLRQVAADVYRLSGPILAAHILLMVGLQMMPWLVTQRLGYAAVGSYSAAMTLANLANPILTGFINAMMPAAAAAYPHGPAAVRSALAGGVLTLSCTSAVVSLVTAVFAADILPLAFGQDYAGEARLAQVLAMSFFVRSLDIGPYVGCWAMRRAGQNVMGNIVFILLGGSLALALMPSYGVLGAGIGLLLANLVTVGLRWWNFLKLTRPGELLNPPTARGSSPRRERISCHDRPAPTTAIAYAGDATGRPADERAGQPVHLVLFGSGPARLRHLCHHPPPRARRPLRQRHGCRDQSQARHLGGARLHRSAPPAHHPAQQRAALHPSPCPLRHVLRPGARLGDLLGSARTERDPRGAALHRRRARPLYGGPRPRMAKACRHLSRHQLGLPADRPDRPGAGAALARSARFPGGGLRRHQRILALRHADRPFLDHQPGRGHAFATAQAARIRRSPTLGDIAFFFWITATVLLTVSRTGILGLLLGLGATALLRGVLPHILLVATTLGSMALLVPGMVETITDFIERGQDAEDLASLTGRTSIYDSALAAIGDNWLLGYGFRATRAAHLNEVYDSAGNVYGTASHAHNAVLESVSSLGLAGAASTVAILLSFLACALALLRDAARQKRAARVPATKGVSDDWSHAVEYCAHWLPIFAFSMMDSSFVLEINPFVFCFIAIALDFARYRVQRMGTAPAPFADGRAASGAPTT